MTPVTLEPGPGFGVGRGFAIRGPFPVQAPDKAPETCTWSTRSADRGSQVSASGVGLPFGAPFRCKHRIKHRKRAPGQRGLRTEVPRFRRWAWVCHLGPLSGAGTGSSTGNVHLVNEV